VRQDAYSNNDITTLRPDSCAIALVFDYYFVLVWRPSRYRYITVIQRFDRLSFAVTILVWISIAGPVTINTIVLCHHQLTHKLATLTQTARPTANTTLYLRTVTTIFISIRTDSFWDTRIWLKNVYLYFYVDVLWGLVWLFFLLPPKTNTATSTKKVRKLSKHITNITVRLCMIRVSVLVYWARIVQSFFV
jgi:hypothetical protein